MADRIALVLDRILNVFIVLTCLLMMLIGGYTFYDRLIHGEILNGGLFPANGKDGPVSADSAFIRNQVGWLTIDDTNINYPIMQGKDNVEYLDKNIYGESNASGSIFLEWSNDKQLQDEFSIIYGQSTMPDLMFGSLDQYLKKDYFDAHQNGMIFTSDHQYEFRVFAAYEAETSDGFIFNPAIRTADSIRNYIKSRAGIYKEPDPDCRIVALSTCTKEKELQRTVVFATISEK